MAELPVFSKHTPRILRQQLLNELVMQYLTDRHQASGVDAEDDNEHHSAHSSPKASKNVSETSSTGSQRRENRDTAPPAPTQLLSEYACRPSIQRFHGALLFVDISGFTPLSLKLDVETLKNQINGYFTKILEIVEKWGGDVVKFAGDALYIVWSTDIHAVTAGLGNDRNKEVSVRSVAVGTSLAGNSRFNAAAKQALEKAVACGLEISVACGKYEVRLDDNHHHHTDIRSSSGMLGRFLPHFSLSNLLHGGSGSKVLPTEETETVVYLDVHAGVSMGLMAGVDIGHHDRWEYFLVGEPVSRVAECEGEAEKGDVVICKKAHSLLHNRTSNGAENGISNRRKDDEHVTIQSRRWGQNQQHPQQQQGSTMGNAQGGTKLSCGCFVTKNGLFCVSKLDTHVPSPAQRGALRKSRSRSKLEGDFIQGEMNAQNAKINEEVSNDLENIFNTSHTLFKQGYAASFSAIQRSAQNIENCTVEFDTNTTASTTSSAAASKEMDMQFLSFFRKQLRVHFTNWVRANLLDDIVRHVHEATRDSYMFGQVNRLGVFHELVRAVLFQSSFAGSVQSIKSDDSANTAEQVSNLARALSLHHATSFSATNGNADIDSPIESKVRLKPERSSSKLSVKHFSQEAQSTAELRTVTVMFIKIDSFDLKLMVDSFRSKSKSKFNALCYESFYFLDRTDNEIASDQSLLNRLQRCMELLCTAFKENDGQLRQFIVDDKGTVCIGTFGLRGAVSADNAAAAVLAAKKIISGMPQLGLTASIGITSGKTYCGLVGSVFRHEYAVMGPSTNLSARLMCKAPPNCVICDTETKNRDRMHLFDPLNEVTAKGYSEPVMTYRPIFDDMTEEPQLKPSDKRIDRVLGRSRGSDHSLTVLLSPFEKIMRLADSEFYITNQNIRLPRKSGNGSNPSSDKNSAANNNNNSDAFMKLFGRSNEISLIFHTLFSPQEEGQFTEVFRYKERSKMIAICGTAGVGKSALVTAISRKLGSTIKQDRAFNIAVIHKKQSSVHSNVPLYSWRSIVLELLRQINQAMDGGENSMNRSRYRSSRIVVKMDVLSGLDIVLERLCEFQSSRSLLLNALGLTPDHQNETADMLSNKEKLQRCMDFIVQLACISAELLRKFILIIIENIESLDKWSLVVLHKIWLASKGLGLLVTYSPSHEHSSQSWSADAYDNAPPIKPSAFLLYEFFKRYDDAERFKAVDLRPLGKRSILVLARDLFGIHIDDDSDLEKLYAASGGHPLYVVELMKSLINNAQDVSDFAKGKLMSTQSAHIQSQASSSVHHRIEEIICFRMDKLDFSFQVVLKAAAVAASHGRRFTKALIEFILIENDLFAGVTPPLSPRSLQDGADMDEMCSIPGLFDDALAGPEHHHINVVDVLLVLLQKDEFIRLPSFTGANKREISLQMVEDGEEMEFLIPLEQATIYSILIDDQKHFFHERVALFHHKQIVEDAEKFDTLEDRENEGFHWEKAALWSRALRSYMVCAIKEREKGNTAGWADFLKLSYRMYKCMEQETSQLLPLEEWTDATIEFILKTFFGAVSLSSRSDSQEGRPTQAALDQEAYQLLRDDFLSVYEVFEIDGEVLPLVATLHVHLADLYMQQYEEMDIILFVLGVAFKLFLVAMVGKENILQYYINTKQISNGGNLLVDAGANSPDHKKPFHRSPTKLLTMKQFEIRDYSFRRSVLSEKDCLHLLSTFSIAYHLSAAASADFQEMISRITERCVQWTSANSQCVQYIQSLNLQVLQLINTNSWAEAIDTCQELLRCYDPRKHAQELHNVFGLDILLYLLAKIAQRMLLVGKWEQGESYADRVLQFLGEHAEHHHPSSILLALIPLLPTLVAVGRAQDALRLWESVGLHTVPMVKLEIALKPVCAAMDPWLQLSNGKLSDFQFSLYFSPPSIVDKSETGAHLALPKALLTTKSLPAPTAGSLARAISTVFSEDVLSDQLVKLLIFGGCSLSSINAQIATFELLFDRENNTIAQHHFIANFEEVMNTAMNDSPGAASSVNALNMCNAVQALMNVREKDSSIPLDMILDRLKKLFLDDVLALVRVWKEDGLLFAVQIVARFAVHCLELDNGEVAAQYKQLMEESSVTRNATLDPTVTPPCQ